MKTIVIAGPRVSRMSTLRSRTLLAAPAALLLSGCFATQTDIRVLQGDIGLIRSEAATADSARRVAEANRDAQLNRMVGLVKANNDSINSLTKVMMGFRSDITTSMSSVEQQLLQIQELTGQSQRRLQEMRTSIEEHQNTQAAAPAGPGASPSATAGDGSPGPDELFQAARQQLLQGSNESARGAFQDLLTKYPKSDVAADAQFYVAESFAADQDQKAADSVYAIVSAKYPSSPRAATAMYKRGVSAQNAKDAATARKLFNTLIAKYPRSDEASLAKDRIRALK